MKKVKPMKPGTKAMPYGAKAGPMKPDAKAMPFGKKKPKAGKKK